MLANFSQARLPLKICLHREHDIVVVVAVIVVEPECKILEQRDPLADSPVEVVALVPQGKAEVGPRHEQFPLLREIAQHTDRTASANTVSFLVRAAVIGFRLGKGKKEFPFEPMTLNRASNPSIKIAVAAKPAVIMSNRVHAETEFPGGSMEQPVHWR